VQAYITPEVLPHASISSDDETHSTEEPGCWYHPWHDSDVFTRMKDDVDATDGAGLDSDVGMARDGNDEDDADKQEDAEEEEDEEEEEEEDENENEDDGKEPWTIG